MRAHLLLGDISSTGNPSVTEANGAFQPNSPELSVVIPVKDEAGSLEPLLAEINAALSGKVNFEVVCVNDASQDGTLNLLRAAQHILLGCGLFPQERNAGKSAALRTSPLPGACLWLCWNSCAIFRTKANPSICG